MKSSLNSLSNEDKSLLAHFVGSKEYKVLRKLIDAERILVAKDHVDQKDILEVRFLSGKTGGLKGLIEALDQNKKNVNKKDSN